MDHFPWHGKRSLDSRWAGLDYHSKVALIANFDDPYPKPINSLWLHEVDKTNEIARIFTFKLFSSTHVLNILDDTLLREDSWNGGTGSATHLVSAVEYGVDISCIVQRYLRNGEALEDAEIKMRAFCDELTNAFKCDAAFEFRNAAGDEIVATIYGMEEKPMRCDYRKLLKIMGDILKVENLEKLEYLCRPLHVGLMPLKIFNEIPFNKDLSEDYYNRSQEYLDCVGSLRAQANTLLQINDGVKYFTTVRPLLHAYRELLEKDENLFCKMLRHLVIQLRDKPQHETEMLEKIKILIEEGKIFTCVSEKWLNDLRNEIRQLNTVAVHALQLRIPFILDKDEIDRYLTNVKFDYVCIFILPPLSGQLTDYLDRLKKNIEEISQVTSYSKKSLLPYSTAEQELWYCLKRKQNDFYKLARQFFKDVTNYQIYQNKETKNGTSIAFLITHSISFLNESSDAPSIAVFEDGLLTDEHFWAGKFRTLLNKHARDAITPNSSSDLRGKGDSLFSAYDISKQGPESTNTHKSCSNISSCSSIDAFSVETEISQQLKQEGQFHEEDSHLQDNNYNISHFSGPNSVSRHEPLQSKNLSIVKADKAQDIEESPIETSSSCVPFNFSDTKETSEKRSANCKGLNEENNEGAMFTDECKLLTLTDTASEGSLEAIGKTDHRLHDVKDTVREKSQLVANGLGMEIYSLAVTVGTSEKKGNKVRKFMFNQNSEYGESNSMHRRTILLMGATGSGKSSLINSIVNYILGVKWEDTFRFQLVPANNSSPIDGIAVYEINHVEGLQVPFSLTIIDTPGYGAKHGVDGDKNTTESIRQFFKDESSVQVVDAVCFVCSIHGSSTTKMQEYITHSMLSIFGKDVKENIHIFFTFTDSKPSSVPEFVRKTKTTFWGSSKRKQPCHYLISNLACLGNPMSGNSYDLWLSSRENFKKFFSHLTSVQSKSLVLSRKVLDERKKLEKILEILRPKISEGLQKMDEIQKYRNILSKHDPSVSQEEASSFEIKVAVMKKMDISSSGNHLTNCQVCQMTCHYPCAFREDQDKRRCYAIDGKTGFCRICPNKCSWSVHFNQIYRWVYSIESREGNIETLTEKYNASSLTTFQLIEALESEFKSITTDVLRLVDIAADCIQRLEQMALHFSPCTTSSYLSRMIDSERQQKLPGFEERIAHLRNLLDLAELSDRIHRNEPLLP